MDAYSKDLRRKIVEAVGRGMSKTQAARTFGVSRSSVKRYVGAATKGEPLVPKRHPGSRPKLDDPLYGWARRGWRARFEAPRNRGKNVTLLASMSAGGMGRCLAVEGATTRGVFEAYLERVLAPSLRPGQVVVMDNLSAHKKGGRVKEIVEERGCELAYLPPYSPDLNPIEQAFAKVKGLL